MAATVAARFIFFVHSSEQQQQQQQQQQRESHFGFLILHFALISLFVKPGFLHPLCLGVKSLVRRELSTLQPVHSAVASACLVSKLPRDANSCAEGRFANYLSPI